MMAAIHDGSQAKCGNRKEFVMVSSARSVWNETRVPQFDSLYRYLFSQRVFFTFVNSKRVGIHTVQRYMHGLYKQINFNKFV